MEAEGEFEVWQDGQMVAGTYGPREQALTDALHYGAVYGQDGPCRVVEVIWRSHADG